MTSKDIRDKYIKFFVMRGHKQISAAKLVPENDPSTLFTSSGMQPLVPYLLGQVHPEGKRLINSQPSFRAEDIEEVGDNRHTTFFEMLGNWSLGDYFKEEQLAYFWEFLIKELNLPKEKLYVTIFSGNGNVPEDKESYEIWKSLGIAEDHIYKYGVEKNWWSRSGAPEKMPVGEIGGPDSEVFFEFTSIEHDKKYGEKCHPNCECGRFLEIGNSVFIQYQKMEDGTLKELTQKNVDFGGGLERLAAATLDTPDVFQTDLYLPIIQKICSGLAIDYEKHRQTVQVIADHVKAATFLIKDGVVPGNKLQSYVLRRLLRRAATKAFLIDKAKSNGEFFQILVEVIINIYPIYFEEVQVDIKHEVDIEVRKFRHNVEKGLKDLNNNIIEYKKMDQEAQKTGKGHIPFKGGFSFYMYESYGFPPEVTLEELQKDSEIKSKLDVNEFWQHFNNRLKEHQEKSRTASAGMFKGGLADHSEIVTKYHTATHLLHQALRDILGPTVFQKGSNITSERLRFDFSYDKKMTDEEIRKTEDLINKKIEEDLKVDQMIIPLKEAKNMNAIGLFDEKYASNVSLYGIGPNHKLDRDSKDQRERDGYYSLEFCGGPHVEHTGVIGKVKITKEKAVSAGIRRIRIQLA